jgi:hypothetical protein
MYYDPVKEAAEERKKSLNSLQAGDPREHLRAEIRRKWKIERKGSDKRNNTIRIFIFIIFAVFSIYLIFFTNMVNHLVSLFLR